MNFEATHNIAARITPMVVTEKTAMKMVFISIINPLKDFGGYAFQEL